MNQRSNQRSKSKAPRKKTPTHHTIQLRAQRLRVLFDPDACDFIWDPKVFVWDQGHFPKVKSQLYVVIPLLASNQDIKVTVQEAMIEDQRDASQPVKVPWNEGSIILVPGKANMIISGCNSGYLAFLGIAM